MKVHGGKCFQISIACCLICVGLGYEMEIVETVHKVLNNFNAPLKLTIDTCWDAEAKVKFASMNSSQFQVRFMRENSNVTQAIFERHHEVVVVDLNCVYGAKTLSKISPEALNFNKVVTFDSNLNSSDCVKMNLNVRKILQDVSILPGSQFFMICKNFKSGTFDVKQVFRVGLNEPLIVEEYATYNRGQFVTTTTLTSVQRRRNFQGFELKASMVLLDNDSLNHLDDYRDIHIDAESKLCYQLTKHLMSYVNGTVKYSIVSSWGYKNKTTGQWTGMIGEVLRNEADIGATALFFTTERISVIEYISHSSTANSGFLFLSPKLSYTNNLYALPFERLLWICSLILVLLMTLCLVVAVVFELKTFAHSEEQCSVSDAAIIVFGALCQQGAAVTPISITGKWIMILSFITLMFLFVSYSANIVALLQSPSNQIRTLRDLYDTKLELSIVDTVYNRHFFATETEPFRKKFYEDKLFGKDGKPKFNKLEDGIKSVREGQYAFYTELSSAFKIISETFIDTEKCGLKAISFFQMNLNPWYSIQKNSPYKDIFKSGMMRIHEHGLKQRENLRYYLTKPKCLGGGASFVSATLTDTGPVMLILVWGYVITLIIFIGELIAGNSSYLREKLLAFKIRISGKSSKF